MTNITIRSAAAPDIEDSLQLLAVLGYSNIDRAEFTTVFHTVLNHPEMTLLLAEDSDGRIVGLATISHRPQLRLAGILVSLDELAVAADARGQGVGRALLERVKGFATSLGARRLELHTRRERESYRRGFYVRNGLVEVNSALLRLPED